MGWQRLETMTGAVALAVVLTVVLGVAAVPAATGEAAGPAAPAVPDAPTDSLVLPGAEMRQLATGYQFTEGPAPDAAGGLWFTDVFGSKLLHWSPEDGAVQVRDETDRLNGLAFDHDGTLLGCEGGGRRLIRHDLAGGITVVADSYGGGAFNAPNDVWVAPDGGIYFTDPMYDRPEPFEQDGAYVYYVPPGGGEIVRASGPMSLPNGLVGTPDGRTLYVTDSAGGTFRFAIAEDGTLGEGLMVFARGGDGMTLDEEGHIYLAGGTDVWVRDPSGTLVERITPPEPPSNVAFGGPVGQTLFITARSSVYALEMAVRGAYVPPGLPTATPAVTPTPTATPPPPEPVFLPRADRGRPPRG